ncbi:hypothetical protein D3C78_1507780 [compost metagenome]
MQQVSMYCPECEVYSKRYNASGEHVCGNEVVSGSYSVPTDFEGWIEQQPDGSIKLISR